MWYISECQRTTCDSCRTLLSTALVPAAALPPHADRHQREPARPGVRRAQADDHRRGHLRAPRGDPPRRAAALAGARRVAHADPRGDDAARAGGLPAHGAAPRHLHRPQDEEADHRDDRDVGGAREHGGAARDDQRVGRGHRRAARDVRRVPQRDAGRAHPRILRREHRVPPGDHPAFGLAPDGQDDRRPASSTSARSAG